MKGILVTGGSGFVGRHLIPLLADEFPSPVIINVDPKGWIEKKFEQWSDGSEPTKFDIVVHLAANIESIDKRMEGKLEAYKDILLDFSVCEWVAKHPPNKAFVYMSSCAIENQEDPYAFVKSVGERMCKNLHESGVPVVILRPFSGYGSDQAESYPFSAILGRVMRKEQPVKIWGSGYQVRDWIHVDDLARAIVWAIENAPRGIPVDIGTGEGTSINELVSLMGFCAFPDLPKLEIETDETKPESGKRRIADTFLANSHGFRAKISLEEGIRSSVELWKARHAQAIGA